MRGDGRHANEGSSAPGRDLEPVLVVRSVHAEPAGCKSAPQGAGVGAAVAVGVRLDPCRSSVEDCRTNRRKCQQLEPFSRQRNACLRTVGEAWLEEESVQEQVEEDGVASGAAAERGQ